MSFAKKRRMNQEKKFHGYSNRETWLVAIWIDNDVDSNSHWRTRTVELVKTGDRDRKLDLARELEDWSKERQPEISGSVFSDLLTTALSRVDWLEVAQRLWDDYETELCQPVVIHEYTRSQAIADGELVDVTGLAEEAGFKIPVAMTSAAWANCVAVPPDADGQDETGRLWDVLNVLFYSIKASTKVRKSSTLRFKVSVRTGKTTTEEIELKSICGPGDDVEPVITIMLPNED